jgi:hypothetical protein
VAITSAVGNAVVAVHSKSDSASGINSVDNTQVFIDNTGASGTIFAAGNRAAGAASVTLSGVLTGAGGVWTAAGCDVLAAGAAVTPSFNLAMLGM